MKKISISKVNLQFFNLDASMLLEYANSNIQLKELVLIVRPSDSILVYCSKLNNVSLNGLRNYLQESVFPKNRQTPFYLNTSIKYIW